MVLEMAVLEIIPGMEEAFEEAIHDAEPLIASTPGFQSIAVRRCIEIPSRYLLLVEWERLEDHTVGFRQSERYERWKKLLHHFYNPFPEVEHYGDSVTFRKSD
jgi:heme-degrading monooxygenase HmoA